MKITKNTDSGHVTEKDIENLILAWLDYNRMYPIKIDNTGIFDPRKGVFRHRTSPYKRSPSDIIFFYKDKVIFCEVKTPKELGYIKRNWDKIKARTVPSNRHLHNQFSFMEQVQEKNQIYFFVDSIEELKKQLAVIDNKDSVLFKELVPIP
jgi:hypothetical protein